MGNKITNEVKETVLNMLNDGKSKVEIAEKCGISPFVVERIIYNSQFIDMVFESDNEPPIPFPEIPEPQKVEERGCSKFEEIICTVGLILILSIAVSGIVIGISSNIQ